MKNLITTAIITGVGYPPSKPGFDYLYLSNKEMLNILAQSLGGPLLTNAAYILFGCVKTDLGGGNFAFSEGAIYDSKTEEIYKLDAVASIPIATAPVMKITNSFPAAFNPVKFTDGSLENAHEERKLVISDGALDSEDINFDELLPVSNNTMFSNDVTVDTPSTSTSPVTLKSKFVPKKKLAKVGDCLEITAYLVSTVSAAEIRTFEVVFGGFIMIQGVTGDASIRQHYLKVLITRISATSVFVERWIEHLDSTGTLVITANMRSTDITAVADMDLNDTSINLRGTVSVATASIVSTNLQSRYYSKQN